MLELLGLILGVVALYYSFKLLYAVGCMLLLPSGHPWNVRLRRERWENSHPGEKHPFRN